MSHGKQFTFYTHKLGPNGWKVAAVFEELELTYESIYLDFQKGEQKLPEHVKYNPNGRIPTIIDHKNNDFVLWESGAIMLYLVERYDPEHKISVADASEKYQQLQWLFFQASGQGPYYGQAAWFIRSHSEQIPSAQERYRNEIERVLSVLEGVLSKQEWLVGEKPTIADISFVQWDDVAIVYLVDFDIASKYPATAAWHQKLHERPAMKKAMEIRSAFMP